MALVVLNKTLEFFGLGEFEEPEAGYARYESEYQNSNEIVILNPTQYSDVKIVSENFRKDIPVIVNLHSLDIDQARRLIDFISGLTEGLGGTIERVSGKTFIISPQTISVNESEDA